MVRFISTLCLQDKKAKSGWKKQNIRLWMGGKWRRREGGSQSRNNKLLCQDLGKTGNT